MRILGLLEARLTDSDRVVLGSLVEGTWPPESNTDAWLSRPMRLALGLDLPERRIGLTAHDFAQLLGARGSDPEPLPPKPTARQPYRRASYSGSPPSPASVRRRAVTRGGKYISWARELDRPELTPGGETAGANAAARRAAKKPFGH